MEREFNRDVQEAIDVQRDFPYNQLSKNNCLNSKTSRIIYKLFCTIEFDAAISFHSGDNYIGFPWGSFSRSRKRSARKYVAWKTPDF